MTEDLLRDLVEYKTYKDKAVMMASKSLIQLFRTTCPELLHKRDRGRPTEATVDLKRKEFGETDAAEFVPGAEVVEDEDEEGDESDAEDDSEEESDDEELLIHRKSVQQVSGIGRNSFFIIIITF